MNSLCRTPRTDAVEVKVGTGHADMPSPPLAASMSDPVHPTARLAPRATAAGASRPPAVSCAPCSSGGAATGAAEVGVATWRTVSAAKASSTRRGRKVNPGGCGCWDPPTSATRACPSPPPRPSPPHARRPLAWPAGGRRRGGVAAHTPAGSIRLVGSGAPCPPPLPRRCVAGATRRRSGTRPPALPLLRPLLRGQAPLSNLACSGGTVVNRVWWWSKCSCLPAPSFTPDSSSPAYMPRRRSSALPHIPSPNAGARLRNGRPSWKVPPSPPNPSRRRPPHPRRRHFGAEAAQGDRTGSNVQGASSGGRRRRIHVDVQGQ